MSQTGHHLAATATEQDHLPGQPSWPTSSASIRLIATPGVDKPTCATTAEVVLLPCIAAVDRDPQPWRPGAR